MGNIYNNKHVVGLNSYSYAAENFYAHLSILFIHICVRVTVKNSAPERYFFNAVCEVCSAMRHGI
jgi:hypothetical protein